MKEKGKRITCPKCGREGALILRKTSTKGKTYEYYAVAHSRQSAVSESGKRVHRIRWHYLNKKDVEKLRKLKLIDCAALHKE